MTFTDIAPQMGLTKARLSQVMKTAPAAERLIFGIGPVTIGVPYRYQTTDRARPLIAGAPGPSRVTGRRGRSPGRRDPGRHRTYRPSTSA